MRIMGIDYGDARTGVAISDLLCTLVGSALVIPSRNAEKAIADIVRLAEENQVGEIVVGLPKNMDGSEGFRAERTRRFAEMLTQKTGIDCEFMDERLSTAEAYTYMNITGFSSKKRRGVIDTLSAQVILQSYIDMGF